MITRSYYEIILTRRIIKTKNLSTKKIKKIKKIEKIKKSKNQKIKCASVEKINQIY
jgi:hypothetical protein